MPLLETWRGKDVEWIIEANIKKLFARQDLQWTKKLWTDERKVIEVMNVEEQKESARKKRSRTTSVVKKESKEIDFHMFPRSSDGKELIIPWGGHYNIFDTTLRRVCKEVKALGFSLPRIGLIEVSPEEIRIPIEEVKDKLSIEIISECRHSKQRKGEKVRGDVAYEVLKDVTVSFRLKSNGVCPLEDNEVAQLLHALETCKFGPTGRGKIEITNFARVK